MLAQYFSHCVKRTTITTTGEEVVFKAEYHLYNTPVNNRYAVWILLRSGRKHQNVALAVILLFLFAITPVLRKKDIIVKGRREDTQKDKAY